MALNTQAVFDAIQSHALGTGLFERVGTHEPQNAPGTGLTAAIWADSVTPVGAASGLTATSARVAFMVRIYSSALQNPPDAIDPNVLTAVDTLMVAYAGDFELGGNVRNIDLHGAHGPGLGAQAGYITQDGMLLRVVTVTLPVIINDAFPESP